MEADASLSLTKEELEASRKRRQAEEQKSLDLSRRLETQLEKLAQAQAVAESETIANRSLQQQLEEELAFKAEAQTRLDALTKQQASAEQLATELKDEMQRTAAVRKQLNEARRDTAVLKLKLAATQSGSAHKARCELKAFSICRAAVS